MGARDGDQGLPVRQHRAGHEAPRRRSDAGRLALLAILLLLLAAATELGNLLLRAHRPQAALPPPARPAGPPQGGGPTGPGHRPSQPGPALAPSPSAGPAAAAALTAARTTPPGPGTASPSSSAPASPRPAAAASAPVTCRSDLPLAQAPNAPYAFLCTQGGRPLTWARGQAISIYTSGLTPLQSAVLPGSLAQWEKEGNFSVVQVASPAQADVTITDVPLNDVEDGYARVQYGCSAGGCFYDHATVQLSSTASLTQTLWASTILHELGHVAGLNHIARAEQVMYPIVSDTSPDAYTPGDIQGLQALAQARQSSSPVVASPRMSGVAVAAVRSAPARTGPLVPTRQHAG